MAGELLGHVEPLAVVADLQDNAAVVVEEAHFGRRGPGVLDDVVHRLLGHAVEHLLLGQRQFRLRAKLGGDGDLVARAEGGFIYGDKRYKLVDLPGTYSLLAASVDEEIARDFILFGQPDVTVVVVDATRLERNLNLALQVLEITDKAVICLNLMDEAKRHGLTIDDRRLASTS